MYERDSCGLHIYTEKAVDGGSRSPLVMEGIGKTVVDRWWRMSKSKSKIINRNQNLHTRLIVNKASNRAAVHGAKLPVTKTINREEVDMEINNEKEKKNIRTQEVEKKLDSEINRSDVSNDEAR